MDTLRERDSYEVYDHKEYEYGPLKGIRVKNFF